mgnify:CR=1 FL=1
MGSVLLKNENGAVVEVDPKVVLTGKTVAFYYSAEWFQIDNSKFEARISLSALNTEWWMVNHAGKMLFHRMA